MADIAMTNIRSVDLNLLAAFDALFDERSVTRAADRLSLTQPTVSGMLHRLRRMFSDPLFVRTSHGVLPTRLSRFRAGAAAAHLALPGPSFRDEPEHPRSRCHGHMAPSGEQRCPPQVAEGNFGPGGPRALKVPPFTVPDLTFMIARGN